MAQHGSAAPKQMSSVTGSVARPRPKICAPPASLPDQSRRDLFNLLREPARAGVSSSSCQGMLCCCWILHLAQLVAYCFIPAVHLSPPSVLESQKPSTPSSSHTGQISKRRAGFHKAPVRKMAVQLEGHVQQGSSTSEPQVVRDSGAGLLSTGTGSLPVKGTVRLSATVASRCSDKTWHRQ
jgi:hypothetical protein